MEPLWGSNPGKGGVQECAVPVCIAGRTSGSNWAFSQGTEKGLPLYPGQGCPDTSHPFWVPLSLRRAEQIPAAGEEESAQLQQGWDKNEDRPGKQSAKNWCQMTLQSRKGSSATGKRETWTYRPPIQWAPHSCCGHPMLWELIPSLSVSHDRLQSQTQRHRWGHSLIHSTSARHEVLEMTVFTLCAGFNHLTQINTRLEKSEHLELFDWIPHQCVPRDFLPSCVQLPLESDPS